MSGVNRCTVELDGYPDLVVIYLGMRANRPRGVLTLLELPRRSGGRSRRVPTGCCCTSG